MVPEKVNRISAHIPAEEMGMPEMQGPQLGTLSRRGRGEDPEPIKECGSLRTMTSSIANMRMSSREDQSSR